jgi:hypothetical protein
LKSATNPPSREQLLADIALDLQAMAQSRQNPLTEFKPTKESDPRQQILEELRTVTEIVSSKATAEETAAFKQWLMTSSQAAADAAKEGGFMGFGAEQVSQGEKDMLSQVRATIGA